MQNNQKQTKLKNKELQLKLKTQKQQTKTKDTKQQEKNKTKCKQTGITMVALVITILFSYDEKIKCSNSKGFLLLTI